MLGLDGEDLGNQRSMSCRRGKYLISRVLNQNCGCERLRELIPIWIGLPNLKLHLWAVIPFTDKFELAPRPLRSFQTSSFKRLKAFSLLFLFFIFLFFFQTKFHFANKKNKPNHQVHMSYHYDLKERNIIIIIVICLSC